MKNQTTKYDFTMEGFFICIKHIKMGQARPYNNLEAFYELYKMTLWYFRGYARPYNILDIHNFEFMEEEAILPFFSSLGRRLHFLQSVIR